jgi:hypothetical protein
VHVLGQRGGIAQSRLAIGIFLGAAARQGGFGVEDPDETLGGKQREPAGVVEDSGETHTGKVVLRDGAFGHGREQRFLETEALVGFRAKQKDGGGRRALFHPGKKLPGNHV